MKNMKDYDNACGIQANRNGINRRDMLKTAGGATIAATMGLGATKGQSQTPTALKGNIKHSICRWCYKDVSLEELCKNCVRLGIKSIELVGPNDWPVLKKYGLINAMVGSHGITKGLNRVENHAECLDAIGKSIEAASEAGFPNVICFSGNREGMSDDEGLKNCAAGVKKIIGLAEKKNILLCMELLNSKWNHKDYMCDHTAWGVKLCQKVGSPNFKLLYDIYHMQLMEGDIIKTIKDSIQYIGHFHTGGAPGRNEINETQELYYPAIMRAIVETKFDGYVAQEFVPKRDPLQSMEQAIKICDV